jgi:hypothetical protein
LAKKKYIDNICQMLFRYGRHVGVSYDGPPSIARCGE